MTVAAAEVGDAAFEGEAADASTAGRKVIRRPRPRAASRVVRATPEGRAATVTSRARPARNRTPRGGTTPPSRAAKRLTGNYHGAVFAEWMAAVLLVGLLPFARPNKTGVSPYAGKDLVQLFWITLLYLVLAILAVPGKTTARFAAWFGLLVLLAVGLAETASIASAVAGILNPQSTGTGTTPAPATNASTVNPGSQPPSATTSTGISRNVAQQPGTGLS